MFVSVVVAVRWTAAEVVGVAGGGWAAVVVVVGKAVVRWTVAVVVWGAGAVGKACQATMQGEGKM